MPVPTRHVAAYRAGGGQDLFQLIWSFMRDALGEGGPGPIDSLEDAWRQARAIGLAKLYSLKDRAVFEFFPHLATSTLGWWERSLGVSRGATKVARNRAVAAAFTASIDATCPGLTERLQRVDPTITVGVRQWDTATTTQFGRTLKDRSGGTDVYGRVGTAFPNYSCAHFAQVVWPLPWPSAKRAEVERVLNASLPFWCDWVICSSLGFHVGVDGLGQVALG